MKYPTPVKYRILMSSITTALVASLVGMSANAQEKQLWCTYEGKTDGPGAGKTVVLISGDEEYRSEEAFPMLGKILSQHHGFTCHVLFPVDPESGEIDPNNQNNIPGMQLLESADLAIIGLRFRALPDEQMKYFDDYLMAGKPVIALRTSTHAFRFTAEHETRFRKYSFNARELWSGGFGKHVLGETWVNHHGHHGKESTRGVIAEDQKDNVLLTGVTDVWGPSDVYGIRKLPEGCHVLLHGQVIAGMNPDDKPVDGKKNDPMMPLAWTRQWDTGHKTTCSLLCTTMGAATDFESEDLRRLIVNAAFQMTGLEDKINESLCVEVVGEFEPTDFGFNQFKKGTKPADYNLK